MAITGAVTLAHIAKITDSVLEKAIIRNLLRYTELLGDIPFHDIDDFKTVAVRWTSLPSPAFRKLNAGYTASVGDTEQVWEAVYPIGGEFNVDRLAKKVRTIVASSVQQMQMHMKATALTLNDYFINGDQATDPDGFDGLKVRVAAMPSRQSVNFGGAGSAALDPLASLANARTFMDRFTDLFKVTNGGNVSAIYCNEGVKWGLSSILRFAQTSAGAGVLDVTKDSFDRSLITYRGIPLRDAGMKVDQSTEVIPETETAGDAGADATSIYTASFDRMEGLVGIQLDPLESYDPLSGGELEATPTNKMRYEWALGLHSPGSFGIARGSNLEGASNWAYS